MTLIGIEIAKMHKANVIHGDLTTSNMMLRKSSKNNGAELASLLRLNTLYVKEPQLKNFILRS